MSDTDIERTTMRRVYLRFTPLFFLMMLFNYLDRFNIGFAALRMNHDLALGPAAFGFGASVFFIGYMIFEIPSNVILHRIGGRIWIARILFSWGAVATAMAFIGGSTGFYVLRFLLGVAEAGLLPGLALFTTAWFPARYRARAIGGYVVAGQLASVVAGPLSTAMMTWCDGLVGLHGWQWMFIVEGLPTVVLGAVSLFLLTERPDQAAWLSRDQKQWLVDRLSHERGAIPVSAGPVVARVLRDGRVWGLVLLFGSALVGIDGLHFWQPQIIRSFGKLTDIEIGLLSAVPALLSAAGTVVVSYTSDRTGDRQRHLGGLYLLGAAGFAALAFGPMPVAAYVLLCLAGLGLNSGNSLFWAMNASLATGSAAAVSIALVNTMAQFGGIIGPWMIGIIREHTEGYASIFLALSAFTLVSAVVSFSLRLGPEPGKIPALALQAESIGDPL